MRKIPIYLLVALITFAVIYLLKNKEVADNIGYYLVGFSGAILLFVKQSWSKVKELFSGAVSKVEEVKSNLQEDKETDSRKENRSITKTNQKKPTFTIQRISHDFTSTLGTFFIEDEFLGFTLEPTLAEAGEHSTKRLEAGQYKFEKKEGKIFIENSEMEILPGTLYSDFSNTILLGYSVFKQPDQYMLQDSDRAHQEFSRVLDDLLLEEGDCSLEIKDEPQ